jgi:hypothetical protein
VAAVAAGAREQLEHQRDWDLIAPLVLSMQYANPMEMNRRLRDAITELTGKLDDFKASSDALAGKVVALNRWLVVMTVLLCC